MGDAPPPSVPTGPAAMEPMKPMKPMKPMEPMHAPERWWPADLGESPSASGAQDDLRYAYFADKDRLAVSRGGKVSVHDTAGRAITGVAQHHGGSDDPRFTGPDGDVVELSSLAPAP